MSHTTQCTHTHARSLVVLMFDSKVLSMFGSKREEDKMVGYLSFLKVCAVQN